MGYKHTYDTIYTHFQGITNNIYGFGRPFFVLSLAIAGYTGAARTEGYYKISHHEKSGYLRHARGVQESQNADSDGPRLVFVSSVLPPGVYTCTCHVVVPPVE